MNLSAEQLARARAFVETRGRPLEAARLAYCFDGAPAAQVLAELVRFQNPDGGFGHGLEPDMRTPESSALATSVAFQIVREVGDAPKAMAAPAIGYLLQTLERDRLRWRIVPPEAEASPHAPWWGQVGLEKEFGAFRLNPTAELLGYLLEHHDMVPADLLAALSEAVLGRYVLAQEASGDTLQCGKRLAATPGLDDAYRAALLRQLTRLAAGAVCRDPARWASYSVRPLHLAERPDSPFYPLVEGEIATNLDYEIATQGADGAWAPTWTWGGLYPEAWPRARAEWCGVLIVDKLRALQAYGRVEGP